MVRRRIAAAIVGAGLNLASAEGLEAITLQAVADRIGLSKSGVFSRIGSREALQKAVIEEFGRRFLADVFVPAMQLPKGLPRLDEIVQRWIVRTRDVEAHTGCIFSAGAFELDDREGPLRDLLHAEDRQLVDEALAGCLDGEPLVLDARFRTGDGNEVLMEIVGEATRGADGTVATVRGSIQDVGEQRRAARQRRDRDPRSRAGNHHRGRARLPIEPGVSRHPFRCLRARAPLPTARAHRRHELCR